jgi:hypothetical protein
VQVCRLGLAGTVAMCTRCRNASPGPVPALRQPPDVVGQQNHRDKADEPAERDPSDEIIRCSERAATLQPPRMADIG